MDGGGRAGQGLQRAGGRFAEGQAAAQLVWSARQGALWRGVGLGARTVTAERAACQGAHSRSCRRPPALGPGGGGLRCALPRSERELRGCTHALHDSTPTRATHNLHLRRYTGYSCPKDTYKCDDPNVCLKCKDGMVLGKVRARPRGTCRAAAQAPLGSHLPTAGPRLRTPSRAS
jgi:hypothetical protein